MASQQQDSYGTFAATPPDQSRSTAHNEDLEREPFLNSNNNDNNINRNDGTTTVPPALKRPIAKLSVTLTPLNLLTTTLALALAAAAGMGLFYSYKETERYIAPGPPLYRRPVSESGVGRLPFMGFNTWNAYHCDINEDIILENAILMKDLGLVDVGYTYMNIDDCYSEKKRDKDGNIVAHKKRFSSGMRNLTDKIHALGMKAGIYSDSGWYTCQMYPGSYTNEERDAKLFHDWGFDLLKYDNCAVPYDHVIREGMVGKFQRMADAISKLAAATGAPPMLYSLCQWGREEPWLWARRMGQTWRTTDDIGPHWDALSSIINQNSFISWASDFYGHNDLDILEVGNGDTLTVDEAKSHFTAWALMKSPLLIGAHLPTISKEALDIYMNREIIAINQDPVVGTAVTPFRWGINPDRSNNYSHPAQYWSGESSYGAVFMLLNTLDHPADMTFRLTESPWIRAGRKYHVRDLWAHTDNGTATREFTAHQVPAHGVAALLLRDAGDEPAMRPPCARPEWCMREDGVRWDPW